MRKIYLFLMLILPVMAMAQTRVTIFGDSYSTFEGSIPSTHEPWYAPEGSTWEKKNNDVKKHEGYTIIERIIAYHTGETAALSVAFNKKRLVALGFPFECIKEEKDRTMVMKFLLKKLDN